MRKPAGKTGSTQAKETATKKRATKTAASKPGAAKKTAPKKAVAKPGAAKKPTTKKAAAPKEAIALTAAAIGCCTIAYMDGTSESRNGYTQEKCRQLGISGGTIAATHWQKGVCA